MAKRRSRKMQKAKEEQPSEKPARKEDVKQDELQARISVLIYAAAAVGMGYASLLISPVIQNMATILLGLVALWVVGRLVQAVVGQKEIKWLVGNGIFIYLFVWLISWILFFNLLG